jgi:hypothetical protein
MLYYCGNEHDLQSTPDSILCGPLCDEYKQQAKITKVENQPTESPTL